MAGRIVLVVLDETRDAAFASTGYQHFRVDLHSGTSTPLYISSEQVVAAEVAPSGIWYAATRLFLRTEGGSPRHRPTIWRSDDAGESWEPTILDLDYECAQILVASDGTVYAPCGGAGFLRSDPGDHPFERVGDLGFWTAALAPDGRIVGNAGVALYESSDGGESWTNLRGHFWDYRVRALAVTHSGLIIENLWSAWVGPGIYLWTESWDGFERVGEPFPYANVTHLEAAADGSVYAVAVEDGYSRATNIGLFRSTDDGDTWHELAVPDSSVLHVATRSDGTVVVGTARGLFASRDAGQTWNEQSLTSHPAGISKVLATAGSLFAGTGEGLFRMQGTGGSTDDWQRVAIPRDGVTALMDTGDGVLLAGTDRTLFRSTDQGTTWEATLFEMPTDSGEVEFVELARVTALGRSPWGDLYASQHFPSWDMRGAAIPGIYRSEDSGHNWSRVHSADHFGSADAFAVDSDGGLLASYGGDVWRLAGRTAEWQDLRRFVSISGMSDMVVHPETGPVISSADGRYGDAGIYLNPQPSAEPDALAGILVYDLILAPHSTLFAAAANGVHRSLDGGHSWELISNFETMVDARDPVSVRSLTIADDGTLYAGTAFHGVFRASTPVSHEDGAPDFPPRAELLAIFPNPVHDAATVVFSVPDAAAVHLSLFDALGRRVATLADGIYPRGRHEIAFSVPPVASGVYALMLEVGGFLEARRLVVVR